MKKAHNYGVNIGSSCILITFVIICLVAFATLSIVSADSDYKLTRKLADRQKNYYAACNHAQQSLADIDTLLASLYTSGLTEDEYYAQAGHVKSFAYSISEIQSLAVTITISYPHTAGEPFYTIASWQIITTGSLDYNENLPVIKMTAKRQSFLLHILRTASTT